MFRRSTHGAPAHGPQQGHLMAGLVVVVAIMMILSTVVFQGWQDVKRRDDEAEMIFRAQEIVRAIDRYRKDRGAPPTALDQLIEPGNRGQYFARQLYEDPLVEDGQWGLLYIGPNNEIIDSDGVAPGVAETTSARARLAKQLDRRRDKFTERGIDWRRRPLNVTPAQKQAAGFLPIAGVKSLSTDKPFRVYKGQSEYRLWLFTYLDLLAPGQRGAVLKGGKGGLTPQSNLNLNQGANPGLNQGGLNQGANPGSRRGGKRRKSGGR